MLDDDKQKEEFEKLLELFWALVQSIRDEHGQWESLEALIEQRADFAIQHALEGFDMKYDEMLELINDQDNLTHEQQIKRDIIVAAIDNLVDFSAAEEYQMAREIPDFEELFDPGEVDPEEYEDMEDYLLALCTTYNQRYANVEDMDIEYAMIVALYLSKIGDNTVLTYMTQGDERVRPWHLQYEGYSAPRALFPDWLIPPIEHQCRCFLVEDTEASVIGSVKAAKELAIPEWFNMTFKESVANGGRIFSDEHPYFQVKDEHIGKLRGIAERVKSKYFGNG